MRNYDASILLSAIKYERSLNARLGKKIARLRVRVNEEWKKARDMYQKQTHEAQLYGYNKSQRELENHLKRIDALEQENVQLKAEIQSLRVRNLVMQSELDRAKNIPPINLRRTYSDNT